MLSRQQMQQYIKDTIFWTFVASYFNLDILALAKPGIQFIYVTFFLFCSMLCFFDHIRVEYGIRVESVLESH